MPPNLAITPIERVCLLHLGVVLQAVRHLGLLVRLPLMSKFEMHLKIHLLVAGSILL